MEEQAVQNVKRDSTNVLVGMILTWLCAWLVPELETMITMYKAGHGLDRWQLFGSAVPGLILLAIFLNQTVYFAGKKAESVQPGRPLGERVKLFFLTAGSGLPYALLIAAVFLAGRLFSNLLLGRVSGSGWIAAVILVAEIVLTDILLIRLIGLYCGKRKGTVITFLVLIPVLVLAYAGIGFLISWAEGFSLFAGKPMYRLCLRMLAAALDAAITTPVLLRLTKNTGTSDMQTAGNTQSGDETAHTEQNGEQTVYTAQSGTETAYTEQNGEQTVYTAQSGDETAYTAQNGTETVNATPEGTPEGVAVQGGQGSTIPAEATAAVSVPLRKKGTAIAYAVAIGALGALTLTGFITLGKTQYLRSLSHEVENHYANLRLYSTVGDLGHTISESDKLRADLLLWQSTLYSGAEASKLREEAVELGKDDRYIRLMAAVTSDRPVQNLENLLFASAAPDRDISMALLRFYAKEDNLTERQENLRNELLRYLAGNGAYLDETEIPELLYEKVKLDKVEEKLEALEEEYSVNLAPWEYMVETMKKSDRMNASAKINAVKTYFKDYHDAESVLCLPTEQFFLDYLYHMDWGEVSSSSINEQYLALAEEYPEMVSLQYLAAQSFLVRTADGYPVNMVERHVEAAERYLRLYEKEMKEFQDNPEAYREYQDMILATQGLNGISDVKMEFDEEGLADARYFVGTIYYKAGLYNERYYDNALTMFGDAQDYETRDLIVCTYFDRKDYKTCLEKVDQMLKEMELTQKQKGQLYFLRALCNLPLKNPEASLKDAATLSELAQTSEGEDLLELEWLLYSYCQHLACGAEAPSTLNPTNIIPSDFSEKEWEILSGEEYLYSYYMITYGFRCASQNVRGRDGSTLYEKEDQMMSGWSLANTEGEKLLKDHPNLSVVWYVLGEIWHERAVNSNYEKTVSSEDCFANAVAYLQKSLELDPENGKTWYVLASTYRDMAFALSPSDKTAYFEKAYDTVKKALDCMGEDATHVTDPYGSVIHANRLLSECANYIDTDR